MKVPAYVYILFVALLCMGIQRCYPRVIRLNRLFAMPVLFTALSIHSMANLFESQHGQFENMYFVIWMIGCALGLILGYLHVQNKQIKADHHNYLIGLPGDWSMLFLILAIFGFEFFVHYSIEAGLPLATTYSFKVTALTMLGMIAGMSIGRTLNYFKKFKTTESETLSLS